MLDVAASPGLNPDGGRENIEEMLGPKAAKPTQAKSLMQLTPGEVFSAEILDIQPGVVTLKIGESQLAARTLASPDARIGDKAAFVVRNNTPGQILLEFLRTPVVSGSNEANQASASIVKEALGAANMQYTQANNDLIQQMVAFNLPIDHHSVQRAAFFSYNMPNVSFSHIAFLIENNFAPIDSTVDVFKGMLEGKLDIKNEIYKLSTAIEAMDGGIKEGLTAIFKGKLALDVVNMQNSAQFLNELREAAEEARVFLQQSGQKAQDQSAAVRQALTNIADILDFSANIDHTKNYYQIPFIIDQRENMAELHILKRKGAKKANDKNATALIALDMAHLGRIEIMVNKNAKNVGLQFRSDRGLSLYAVNSNAGKLSDALGDKGYLLTNISLKMIEEKFDITSDKGEQKTVKTASEAGGKRYSFDMRV